MHVRRLVILALTLALGFAAGLAVPLVARPALVPGQDAITDAASARTSVTIEDADGRALRVAASGARRAVLVVYPGALVRPQAYEWLGRRLAADGIETWIVEEPFDVALLGRGRFAAVRARVGDDVPLVLAGHSLGGVVAADDAFDHADAVDGLLLLASYPGSDKRIRTDWKPLLLGAEHDGLATAAKLDAGFALLPPGSKRITVPGAVHAFFGRYGPQRGDGVPTVSRADAEDAIYAAVREYMLAARR